MYKAALIFIIVLLVGTVRANYTLDDQSFYKVFGAAHLTIEVVQAVIIACLLPLRNITKTLSCLVVAITALILVTFVCTLITVDAPTVKTHMEIGNERFGE